MSNILKITDIPTWCELEWSVIWDGRGSVAQPNGVKSIWECAFNAAKKGQRVGFAFEKEAVVIDTVLAHHKEAENLDYLTHLIQRHGGITGVAFAHQDEAEQFVDALEKVIIWKMLQKEYHEQ